MDFIAIELDRPDVWEAFRQPIAPYSQTFDPPHLPSSSYVKLAQSSGCSGPTNDDTCDHNYNQLPVGGFSFNSSVQGGLNSNVFQPDATPNQLHEEAHQDNETTPTQEEQSCESEQANEMSKDATAGKAAEEIKKKNKKLEHGSILVDIGNGHIIALPPKTGQAGGIPTQLFLSQIVDSGYEYTQIVGLVHSHPPSTQSNTVDANLTNLRNRAPSHSLTRPEGDYAVAALFRDFAEIQGADTDSWGARYTHYIIGPDGVLREYDGANPPDSIANKNEISEHDVQQAEKDAKGQC